MMPGAPPSSTIAPHVTNEATRRQSRDWYAPRHRLGHCQIAWDAARLPCSLPECGKVGARMPGTVPECLGRCQNAWYTTFGGGGGGRRRASHGVGRAPFAAILRSWDEPGTSLGRAWDKPGTSLGQALDGLNDPGTNT